ncbi:hypothetical protein F4825DRAFT_301299 [Nemania diffusa]|nr:hypothetical protein F4825DRAFT_301299 [Nemania diffusa]
MISSLRNRPKKALGFISQQFSLDSSSLARKHMPIFNAISAGMWSCWHTRKYPVPDFSVRIIAQTSSRNHVPTPYIQYIRAEIRGSWGLLGYLANLLACVILFTTYKGADFKTLFNTHTIIYVYLHVSTAGKSYNLQYLFLIRLRLVAFYSTMGMRGLELHRQCVCSNVDRFEPCTYVMRVLREISDRRSSLIYQ